MDKVKHEIESALVWLEEGNIERVKLHLGFALQWRNDEASQQERAADCPKCRGMKTIPPEKGEILWRDCPVCSGNR